MRGIEAEYQYLQQVIHQTFQQQVDIGALLKANSRRPGDWNDLFETDLPFFEPTATDIAHARQLLTNLRSLKRSTS